MRSWKRFLVYDGGCGVCGFAKRFVKALDWHGRIRPVRLQDPETERLLAGLDEEARWDSFHFVRNGQTTSRGAGVIEILGVLPLGGGIPRLAAGMPRLRRASDRLYSLFAGLRNGLQCEI